MSAAAEALSAEGVAIWLDGLSRARLDTGSDDYAADIAALKADGTDAGWSRSCRAG